MLSKLELEKWWAEEDKNAAINELEARQNEFLREKTERQKLEEKIQ